MRSPERETEIPVFALLQELEKPAFVLERCGRVTWCNDAASRVIPDTPPWLSHCVEPPRCPRGVRCLPMTMDGRPLFVVVVDPMRLVRDRELPLWAERWALSPQLARVASLAIEGASDKSIASATGLTIATVRTYMQRIYRKVGVSSRFALRKAAVDGSGEAEVTAAAPCLDSPFAGCRGAAPATKT